MAPAPSRPRADQQRRRPARAHARHATRPGAGEPARPAWIRPQRATAHARGFAGRVSTLDLILSGGAIDAKSFAALAEPLVDSGNRIAATAHVCQRNAEILAWGIEVALYTVEECHTAFRRSPAAALNLLRKRFHERVAERIQTGLGIDINVNRDNPIWSAWLDDDCLVANHYIEFEADRIRWLDGHAQQAWKRLCRHRCFIACDVVGLWGQHIDIDAAMKDFKSSPDQLASWKRYLAHPHTDGEEWKDEETGETRRTDFIFGSLERYIEVMESLCAEPRGTLLGSAMEFDKGGHRSRAFIEICKRAQRFLNALQKGDGELYSLGDEQTHPEEACVLLPSAQAAHAVSLYYQSRYENTNEAAGTELGIELGAGELPIRRALYCVATRAILAEMDTLLEVKP